MLRTLALAALIAAAALIGSGSGPALGGPVGPASPPPPSLITALSADVSGGAASIDVDDETVFAAGDKGVINPRSANEEFFVVDSIGSLNLQSPLVSDHSAAEAVVNLTRLFRESKGDVNCDGAIDTGDLLSGLSNIGGLPDGQTDLCPEFGSGAGLIFGDLDCNFDVDTFDYLFLLLFLAGASAPLPPGCAPLGPADPSPSADIEVTDFTTPGGFPAPDVQMPLDTPAVVGVETTVRNTGPDLAAIVEDTFSYSADADCTIAPNFPNPLPPYPMPFHPLAGPIPQTALNEFTIQCSEPGLHIFDICLDVQPVGPPGITDPAPGNNESCATIGALVPGVDIDVIAVELAGLPGDFPFGEVLTGNVSWFTANNGPEDVHADVALSVSVDNAPVFYYRWSADVGDLCFFDNGIALLEIPCAEGHADPSLPTDIADNCFDGVDNDGDGFTDFAGGDLDCIAPISDLRFTVPLPAEDPGLEIVRDIHLRCLAVGPFTLTLDNIESPVPPAIDSDLTNNEKSSTFGFDCVVPQP